MQISLLIPGPGPQETKAYPEAFLRPTGKQKNWIITSLEVCARGISYREFYVMAKFKIEATPHSFLQLACFCMN